MKTFFSLISNLASANDTQGPWHNLFSFVSLAVIVYAPFRIYWKNRWCPTWTRFFFFLTPPWVTVVESFPFIYVTQSDYINFVGNKLFLSKFDCETGCPQLQNWNLGGGPVSGSISSSSGSRSSRMAAWWTVIIVIRKDYNVIWYTRYTLLHAFIQTQTPLTHNAIATN